MMNMRWIILKGNFYSLCNKKATPRAFDPKVELSSIRVFIRNCIHPMPGKGGRDDTPLYGLYGVVLLDRIWFLTSLSLTGYIISCESDLNRVLPARLI